MKIREDMMLSAVEDYIEEIFGGFKFNTINALNKIGVTLAARKAVKKFCALVGDENGVVDVDELEGVVMPEVRKLGVVEIPAIGTKYTFNENDFIKLFAKIKEKAND